MTKKTALELVSESMPLIVHPNLSIRHSMVQFIVNCSQMLTLTELNCRLLPMIEPFLKENQNLLFLSNTVGDITLLLDSLVDPIPRTIYDLILNKINATYLLECFFETLEIFHHNPNSNKQQAAGFNETILNVSALENSHLSGSPLTAINSGNKFHSSLVNCSTPSNMSVCSLSGNGLNSLSNQNTIQQANSSILIQLLDLLVEEGLDDLVKFKLIKLSNLMIRIYKQIKSTKSIIKNAQQQQLKNYQASSTLSKPLGSNSSTFQNCLVNNSSERFDDLKQIKKDNKRLYSLNLFNQKCLPSSNEEWHIPFTLSINSAANIESFQDCDQFEIAKEAKENMSDGTNHEMISIKDNIEEYNVELSDQQNKNTNDLITCPPCVYDLVSLFKHKQQKFGEFFVNKIEFDKCDTLNSTASLNEQSATSMNNSSTTILSSDGMQNIQVHTNELAGLQDGHYVLSNCRPKGKLIANLTEHSKAVSKILTIGNSLFFSSSLDGTIRLWNGSQMNQGHCLVNRSKQTFSIDNKNGKEWFNGMCYSVGKELLIGYSNTANLYIIKIDNQSSMMTLYQTINEFCKNSLYVSNGENLSKGSFLKGYKPSTSNLIESNKKPTTVQNYSITDISSNSPFVFVCSFSNSAIKAFDLRLPLSKSIWTMNTNPNEGKFV